MDTLPSPTQVARNHISLYEALYRQVDPTGAGKVGAVEAATFLKKSGLNDVLLGKIWDFADPLNSGHLTKKGVFTALKLVALAQSGQDVSMSKILLETPPPILRSGSDDFIGLNSPFVMDWTIKPSERSKYEEMFASLGPINDRLPGTKVKPVMLNSKLPVELLGKIWDLSDIDQDGFLDKEEFMLAMHLIYKALENIPIPSVLPPDLIPVSKRKKSLVSSVMPDLLPSLDSPKTPPLDVPYKNVAMPWVVSAAEKTKFDTLFHSLDLDHDGFVTGPDVKEVFLQSGLAPTILAHIWNLCDIKNNGKLNSEQFGLAMYFVNQKLKGVEVPPALSAQMVPPTLRPKPMIENNNVTPPLIETDLLTEDTLVPPAVPAPVSTGNKELDLISEEIQALQKERAELEQQISQRDSDTKQKTTELTSLQTEQESLTSMLRQLEIQKREARKRLDDLDNQISSLEGTVAELSDTVDEEIVQIENLKKQVEEQQQLMEVQEKDLKTKQSELAELQSEEKTLESQITEGKAQVDSFSRNLQETQLQINKSKLKISQLQEQKRQMDSALEHFSLAITNDDPTLVPESMLSTPLPIDPESHRLSFEEATRTSITSPPSDKVEQPDPFTSKDPFEAVNGFTEDPFAGEDPFKPADHSFKPERPPCALRPPVHTEDPFSSDPFSDSFGGGSTTKDDPFKGKDPFGVSPGAKLDDGFADFGNSAAGSDPFGTDPFAPHPPPRPESPTPQLPPKRGKAPPPRPAPPKGPPKPAPSRAAPAPPPPPVNYTPSTHATISAFTADPFESVAQDPFASSSAADPFDPFGVHDQSITPIKSNDPFGASDPFASSGEGGEGGGGGSSGNDGFADFANFDQVN